ncbi:hypothetical protein MOQ72_41895 [Saccharopolyspora sp. K220]|uniref:hypothetical protein n=1 Tax=Saccharopolyspora soli TaxID=2926618 RepID=UPI001F58F687|nr:hypothetical protein [Saccharopolyspora soli]MCI2423972.1 hypothetical protein [Saccharopolyspora soli]
MPSVSLQQTGLLTREQHRAKVIRHEAAHAVVAHLRGMSVTEIRVGDVTNDDVEALGNVSWEHSGELDLDAAAEISMAGWVSDRKWLAENGLADEAHLLSVAAESRGDIGVVYGKGGDAATVDRGVRAAEQNWPEYARYIDAVAESLDYFGGNLTPLVMRAVIRDLDRPRPASLPPVAESPAPPPAPATTATTTTTGGTDMAGIEEIILTISDTRAKSEQIQAALAQVQEWASEIAGRLHATVGQSPQSGVQQAIGAFSELSEQRITELHQLVSGAVSEIEQYGQRL